MTKRRQTAAGPFVAAAAVEGCRYCSQIVKTESEMLVTMTAGTE